MTKSPEQYQPSEEEIKKAEEIMSTDEKISSIERENLLERNYIATKIYEKILPNNPEISPGLKAELFMVLAKKNPDSALSEGNGNALSWAAEEGERDIVRLLIKAGADVNKDIGYGRTALSYAIQEGRKEIIRDLIMAGADPYTKGGEELPEQRLTINPSLVDSDMTENSEIKQFVKDLADDYIQKTINYFRQTIPSKKDEVFEKEFGGKAGIHLYTKIEKIEEIKELSRRFGLSEEIKLLLTKETIYLSDGGRTIWPREGATEKSVLELMEKLPHFANYDACGAKLLTPKILEKLGERKLKGSPISISCFQALSEEQQSIYNEYMNQIEEKKDS